MPDAAGLWGYEREGASFEDGSETIGAWVWVARREGEPEFAYRVDTKVSESVTHVFVQAKPGAGADDAEAPAEEGEVESAVHVGGAGIPSSSDRGAVVRALVKEADAASGDWAKATTVTVPDGPDALEVEKRRWRAIARALELARDAHPKHLGVRRDLVLAYARLLPLVAGTPTETTLAALIPAAVREWERACDGRATAADQRTAQRVLAGLYLQTGPHTLAMAALARLEGDPESQRLRDAFRALGYADVEFLDPVPVVGGVVPCSIHGVHATGEPQAAGAYFDRLTFLVVPDDGGPPLETAFVLSGRAAPDASGSARWALYGVSSGRRRLLRLYGSDEPDGVLVRDAVTSLVSRSLQAVKAAAAGEAVK